MIISYCTSILTHSQSKLLTFTFIIAMLFSHLDPIMSTRIPQEHLNLQDKSCLRWERELQQNRLTLNVSFANGLTPSIYEYFIS